MGGQDVQECLLGVGEPDGIDFGNHDIKLDKLRVAGVLELAHPSLHLVDVSLELLSLAP